MRKVSRNSPGASIPRTSRQRTQIADTGISGKCSLAIVSKACGDAQAAEDPFDWGCKTWIICRNSKPASFFCIQNPSADGYAIPKPPV